MNKHLPIYNIILIKLVIKYKMRPIILPLLLFFATSVSSWCFWEWRNVGTLTCQDMEVSEFYLDLYETVKSRISSSSFYFINPDDKIQLTVKDIELGKIAANFLNNDFLSLINLTLLNCNILAIDEEAFYLPNNQLKFLHIEGNKHLGNVQGSVFRYLTNLERINFSNNSNTYFNFNCDQLSELKTLILDYNKVHSIKSIVTSTCNSLQEVQIQNSEILSIDKNMLYQIPNLISLNLYGNKLQNLNFIDPHNSLSVLNVSTNYITQFNISILSKLTNLTVLDVSNNEIRNFEFQQENVILNKVKTLILSNNELVNLRSLNAFPNVENLVMSSLNIETISEKVFKSLYNLKILDLSDNKFQFLSCEIFSNNHLLRFLNLNKNNLNKTISQCSNLLNNLPNLFSVDLSNGQIYNSVNDRLFANAVHLRRIKLNNNKINNITCSLFQNNTELLILSLSYNNLVNIPACAFKTQMELVKLDLNNNLISELPIGIFSALYFLQSLDLSYNKLHVLHEATMHPLRHLSILDISANNFEDLDPDKMLPHLDGLHAIDISGNPWLCDNLVKIKKALNAALVIIISHITDLENNNIHGIQCKQLKEEKTIITNQTSNQVLEELQKSHQQTKTHIQDILEEIKNLKKQPSSEQKAIIQQSEISINKNIDSNINRIYHVILISLILFISYKVISISFKVISDKRIKKMSNRRSSNSTAIELLHDTQLNVH